MDNTASFNNCNNAKRRDRLVAGAMTVFYRDGKPLAAEQIRDELLEGAADAGVPRPVAEALFSAAATGNREDCDALEELIPGLECITEIGFGAPATEQS
jgi:hypothetical protein